MTISALLTATKGDGLWPASLLRCSPARALRPGSPVNLGAVAAGKVRVAAVLGYPYLAGAGCRTIPGCSSCWRGRDPQPRGFGHPLC